MSNITSIGATRLLIAADRVMLTHPAVAADLVMLAFDWRRMEDENKRLGEVLMDVADPALDTLRITRIQDDIAATFKRIEQEFSRR